MKIIIDPLSKILYSSYYIWGFYELFGKRNVRFSSRYFKELNRKNEPYSHDHYMAFVVIRPNLPMTKVVIDFCDPPVVSKMAYEWSDIYAKINFNIDITERQFHEKIKPIPPGFGIRIWNIWETGYHSFINYVKCRFSPLIPVTGFIKDYLEQYRRPPLKEYLFPLSGDMEQSSGKPYVFMIGTLWPHKNCMEGTNLLRKEFIDHCIKLGCNFEGGFFASPDHPQFNEFRNLVFTRRYSTRSYIRKTKVSAIVFNTPAVHNCHGWKFGEYIAMQKAIITTPISNELPERLIHGENIHIISDINELDGAIELLLKNKEYRLKLESGARDYFLKYSSPRALIISILESLMPAS